MFPHELSTETTVNFDKDDRWLAVKNILDSPSFRKSHRLSSLLCYLSEQSLLERPHPVTEHQIASNVFDRNGNFDPGLDTIVRSHMVRLRQKLDQYAEENSATAKIRVAVPKGEYLVHFERAAHFQPLSATPSLPPPTIASEDIRPASKTPRNFFYLSCILGATIVVLLAALLLVLRNSSKQSTMANPASHPLWNYFFQAQQKTTFIAADSGLALLHKMTSKQTTLAEYLSRDFSLETSGLPAKRKDEVLQISNARYTSVVDLNLFWRLEQLPFSAPGKLEVKYARDVHMNDLKQGNVILSGARGSNPWLEFYEKDMNFVSVRDSIHHTSSYINRHPLAGEPSAFSMQDADPKQQVLGVLAFLPNLDGGGNALVIEGINSMAGTEAISDFLFDDDVLLPFLRKVTKPNGTLSHFEVLIESTSVSGSAGPFHILAYRVYP
jgi:hypothetical protein